MFLTALRFFLICDSKGHLGGLGGGGGRFITLLVAEEYLIRAQLIDEKKDSKRAIEGEMVYEATRLLRIGDNFEQYSSIPLDVHLILMGVNSYKGAFDLLGEDLEGINTESFVIRTSCLLSSIGLVRGHS